jgi:predicted  nucleic acid-binding Zn-ribbon protein
MEINRKLAERKMLLGDYTEAETIVSDLTREQAKAEADLEPVRARLARNQQRVDTGSVSDPKVLQGLTEEIAHLGRRISDLEDAELELMQKLEDATARFAEIQARRSSLEDEIRGLMAERDVQVVALDSQLQHARANRETVVAKLPAGLVSYYERIRDKHSGLGAAELVEGRCGGCRLEVNAAELRAFAEAAPDQLHLCEECGRILVRPSKSAAEA